MLLLVGVINIPIIHYSVEWWNTLHQGPTITKFDKPSIHLSMLIPLLLMAVAGVFVNLVLMAINLLPVPPLDGGRVVTGLLPMAAARVYARIEPFGMIILILLLTFRDILRTTTMLGLEKDPAPGLPMLPRSDWIRSPRATAPCSTTR